MTSKYGVSISWVLCRVCLRCPSLENPQRLPSVRSDTDEGYSKRNMPPDRPDASGIETEIGLNTTRVFDFGEPAYTMKERENTSAFVDPNSSDELHEDVPISEKSIEKNNQSDDELTSLSWLHQQNLLKGLDISNPSKDIKHENILNNNVCDDIADFSENTNSISSLDDGYSPAENNGTMNISMHHGHRVCKKSLQFFTKSSKPPYSFSCLIFMAIEDSPVKALPVKEVYAWILDHFPYFRNAPTGWKNSVRHNLSLNKCFRKVEKAPNLGKGSLWMVDAQYRPNLIQALSRAPFPPPTAQNLSSPEKTQRKNASARLPDPVLFPYLSKRLASSNITDNTETEVDSDVDAAAAAMLSFKHGPIILNHNKDRKRKIPESEKLVPVITRSSSEDHTYSCITSVKVESKYPSEDVVPDFDEQRKIAEGADALLNLAGVSTALNHSRMHHVQGISAVPKPEGASKAKRRSAPSDYSNSPEKRRKRWREWGEGNRYLKHIRAAKKSQPRSTAILGDGASFVRNRKKECVKMRSLPYLCGVVAALLCALASPVRGQRQELGMSFTRHPQPLDAPLGDDVNFECSLNLGAERFAWRHRPLGSDKWLPLFHAANSGGKTSKYVVNFDDESKAGDFRCVAFYGTSGLASDPARLTLATIQKFSDKNDVIIRVPVGSTVPVTCPVPYSVPEAIVQFYKDDGAIQNLNLVGGKTMIIESAKPSDSGAYHCTASNYISSQAFAQNRKTIVVVHANTTLEAPYFVKQPQTEYKVLRGKDVILECFATGYPIPRVTWNRLGSPMPGKSTKSPMGLRIINVQPSDRGEYDCVWSNSAGQVKSVIILKVAEAPKVVKPPKASTFSEGGELELSCAITGQPQPSIEWLINGESLTSNSNLEIRGPTLLISEVEKKHAGIVQCVASNEYGSHSGYNLLRVNPKQHVGGTTESRPDYGIPNSRHKHTRGGGRRRNKEGKRKGTAVLVPPNEPNVTRLSDVSVMVRWSVPENTGLPIQFFKVQYRELGQKMNGKQAKWNTANSEIPNHVRSFEVTDLQPDHTYRFRIAAVYSNNDNKLSENSVRFHLNRDGGFESNRMPIPLLTNTEALGPHEVLLVWQNSDKSASIDGFYVYHRASTSAGDYVKTTVEGKDSSNMTISHLQPDTTYEFKVQSFSVDAASEFSKILRQKTKKAVLEQPVQRVLAENKPRPSDGERNASMYAIIGGVLGGSTLLGGLAAVAVVYKRTKHKQSRESSESEAGKPVANGRVINGGVTDSKINITSNPLAGLDTSEDIMQPKSGQQSPMEMASFLNGQNNNSNNHNNSDSAGTDVNTSCIEPPLLQGTLPSEQPL
ncbi:hypothetical protein KM043_001691 [Ampulex compressa]|nr:hypothetical protein KM043_001691 [Ampulex compressa]